MAANNMTSTSFNVGMSSESKNSSRVLKPPGGGHTDIFGTCEPDPIKHYRHPVSTIVLGDGNNHSATTNQSTTEQITTQSTVVTEQTTSHVEQSSNHVETTTKVEKAAAGFHKDKDASETPYGSRARVPPGGYSSGLW